MMLASLLCKNNKYHHDATVKFIASCRQTCMLFENLAHKMCGNKKGIWTESFQTTVQKRNHSMWKLAKNVFKFDEGTQQLKRIGKWNVATQKLEPLGSQMRKA